VRRKVMFPFKKKPPTKVEIVKKSVSDAAHALLDAVPTDRIEDKLDDLKKTAAHVALQAAQAAHHAGEVASHKLEELQHAAGSLGESAAHRVSDTAHWASGTAHHAGESAAASAAAKAKAAKEAATNAKDALHGRATHLKESATSIRIPWHDRATDDVEAGSKEAKAAKVAAEKLAKRKVEEARDKAEAAKAKIAAKKEKGDDKKDEAKERAEDLEEVRFKSPGVEVEYSDGSSKWQWILLGLAIGALVAILFAPTSGRRSRAAIKDRLGKVSGGAADAATVASDKAIDIAHRVEGLAHQIETKVAADTAADDDATIADRVRSVLGHNEATKHLERLNIDCAYGVVTLRGPLVDAATQDTIVAAVKSVPGVKDVVSDFLIDEEPANPATYAS